MDILRQDRPLRLKILSLLLDPKWISIYGHEVIRPEFFETDDEVAFAKATLTFFDAYNRPPSDPDDVIELMRTDGDYSELAYELFDGLDDYDTALASDIVIQFAREQAVKIAILDSIDDVNRGNLRKPLIMMEEALKVGEGVLLRGIDIVDDVDRWIYEFWVDKVRTPWLHINTVLNGGLGPEELGVLMAPTNVGKSMGLVDIGYAAASIGSGKNVLHLSQEQKDITIAKRYGARMTFRFVQRGDDIGDYRELFLDSARKLMPGKVRIIGGARKMTLTEVHSHIDRAFSEGFNPGLIIDDYADKIVPNMRRSEKRFELSEIYEELRSMSGEFNVPIWTATQSNRASMSKEIITLADIAEDIGKAQIADVVIAICQTKEEYDMDKCRMFAAKIRDGKKNYLFDAKFYGDCQAIITTGLAKRKREQDV